MSLYNLRNPAVKRLMKEAEELLHPTDEYHAQPIEDNLFEWHFTLRGPPNSDFEGGIYHGRISLPPDYPMKPPSIILLTPNGRFETNKKICLSISGHHPESWQPSWSIRTALLAIIGFMPTHGNGALGSLEYTPEERQLLARKSQEWKCPECGFIKDIFLKKESIPSDEDKSYSNNPNDVVSPMTCENTIIKNVSTEVSTNPNSITDSTTTLVHRQRNVIKEENKNVIPNEATSQSQPSIFSSHFVWIIIFIILYLCIRRLFM